MDYHGCRYRIVMYFLGTLFLATSAAKGHGGLSTWISLGIKSPFIVFRDEQEVLSNNSVLLNLTDIRNKLKYVQNLDHFIRPIDSANNEKKIVFNEDDGQSGIKIGASPASVFKVESDIGDGNSSITFLTTAIPTFVNHFEKNIGENGRLTSNGQNPTVMMGPADQMISDDDGAKKERKYIIPLALKTSANDKEKTSSLFHGSSTNIEDLKRHILMLQNLTQSDKNFQSKFVVFPSLQKNGTTDASPAPVTTLPMLPLDQRRLQLPGATSFMDIKEYRSISSRNRHRSTNIGSVILESNATNRDRPSTTSAINIARKPFTHSTMSDQKEEMQNSKMEKITIVPQVFIQNDQTSDYLSDKNDSESPSKFATDSFESISSLSSPLSRTRETMYLPQVTQKFGRKSDAAIAEKFGSENNKTTFANAQNNKGNGTFRIFLKDEFLDKETDKKNQTGLIMINKERQAALGKGDSNRKQRKNGRRRGRVNKQQNILKNDGSTEQSKSIILKHEGSLLKSRNNHSDAVPKSKDHDIETTIESRVKKWSSPRVRRNDNERRQPTNKHLPNARGYETTKVGSSENQVTVASSPSFVTTNSEEGYGVKSNKNLSNHNRTPLSSSSIGDGREKDVVDLNPDLCYTVSALSGGQQKLCAQHTSIMPAISRGARAAIQECKHQFRNRRWNCSIVNDDSVFGPISNIGSPEMAFVYAMAAAAASSFIARACRDGQLASCGCSRSSRPTKLNADWTWGGCGDDMEFGYKLTQSFIDVKEKEKKRGTRGLVSVPAKYPKIVERLLDALNDTTKNMLNESDMIVKPHDLEKLQDKIAKEIEKSNLNAKEISDLQERIYKEITSSELFNLKNVNIYDKLKKIFRKPEKTLNGVQFSATAKARALMNLHNNEAGRRAAIKKSRIICKCHGVSGSCSLITCWQQLTTIREIGDFLREKYDEATQVKMNKRSRLQVKDPRYKIPSALDLIYLEESPDWCRINRQLKWQGTHGRVCNKTSSGLDSCSILCCGRGYNTKKIIVKERCNCKFQWCCQVKCEICTKSIEEYTCK
ncbi:protein Wnt-5 [Anopheles bellator]|uniref:protein Wnt-5 n=1 Tax=Anopheles bellator TaxID=139047 RepID=UPI002649B1A1|nr:protein Wnt-5 [Anopheles bellator]